MAALDSAAIPVLQDGNVKVRVLRGGEETVYDVDVLLLKTTCEECEDSHGLQIKDGTIRPTAAFLADLAGRLGAYIPGCTPTMAWQAWIAATEAMVQLKNAISETPN